MSMGRKTSARPFSRVALIGFGEVGQTFAADLKAAGAEVWAYDILFPDAASIPRQALRQNPVTAAASAAEAAHEAELVVSGVTAASDLDAARSVVPGLKRGTFFLDVNSASPRMKQEAAGIIEAAGGRYVEAAVMTPINPKGVASSMLLGGPNAADFLARARPLGFAGEVFSDRVGPASATKMCRSVIIKGVEALLSESLLSARHYGVEKLVLSSLSDLLPVGDWEKLARYMISRALEHGTRRAEEMREAAATVKEAGIVPLMSLATAERQDFTAAHKAALAHSSDLGTMLDAILKDIAQEPGRGKPPATA
jgi:3-hydroxyisobutyrate dehydrogenase-like beta-hydroxyacid dehydrogenase